MTTWVKGYQLSKIRQIQPEWKVISYQQYNQPEWRVANYQRYDRPECRIASYQQYDQPEWRVASHQRYKGENDLCGCLLNQYRTKLCHQTLVVAPLIQTLKIRSPTCLMEVRIQAFKERLFADQRLFKSGGGGAREVSSCLTKESHWRRSHE